MDAAATGVSAGPVGNAAGSIGANELSTPATYEDDTRHSHSAIAATQSPKAAGVIASTPLGAAGTAGDGATKDVKSTGTRFYDDCHEGDVANPRLRSSRLAKGKGKEIGQVEREKKAPLRLLDLPMDILKDIVKEVTHTNDLTSLARCHSALHRLAIPHIYSRFDIVWPDSSSHAEPRSGVDALTYGLATLVMAEEIFARTPRGPSEHSNRFTPSGRGRASDLTVRRRIGNHYAQFTRKFSLGNGPADWVSEYLITKEGGKMLGTLVALAVARMQSLETFVWDMPTGILRDVWLCLASLGDRPDGLPCKLEKVWVRWHDNSSAEPTTFGTAIPFVQSVDGTNNTHPPPPPPPLPQIGSALGNSFTTSPAINPGALDRVEHPTFSVLPPLKSLSVLDIDELAYLDEMAVLIGNSLDKLRELRVGIARHALTREWVSVWQGDTLQQVDPDYPTAGSVTIGEKRLGGVLGTLTGFVCDMRKPKTVVTERSRRPLPSSSTSAASASASASASVSASAPVPAVLAQSTDTQTDAFVEQGNSVSDLSGSRDVLPTSTEIGQSDGSSQKLKLGQRYDFGQLIAASVHDPNAATSEPSQTSSKAQTQRDISDAPSGPSEPVEQAATVEPAGRESTTHYLDHTLKLESLELERIPLSVPVLQKAIDWTRLTSLTLLYCPNHEPLWKTLRRTFAPTPRSPTYPQPYHNTFSPRKGGKPLSVHKDMQLEYALKLKKVHTNTVSPALISFLKDTLAPNSLEVLFLQDGRNYLSPVTIDHIYKGPLRRHRNSLKKVLIDSSEKSRDGIPTTSTRWRKWMLSRDLLNFMLSGKMPALRELGMAFDYRDWHYFLQHLPGIPHLRSLYIPFIATNNMHGNGLEPREQAFHLDPRELALQVVDIVALRPEVELCYMGITNKCFEILENARDNDSRSQNNNANNGSGPGGSAGGGGGGGGGGGAGGTSDLHMHPHANNGGVIDDGVRSEDDEDRREDEDEDEDVEDAEVEELDVEIHELDDTESDGGGGGGLDEDDDDDDGIHDSDSESEDSPSMARGTARLRLREILFYDDKVAIFKARHGRL